MSEKLQKVLARAGLGSRREIEQWIEDGRLMVNGYPALLGTRVEPKDEVKLDGRRLKLVPEALVNRKVLMYHKPEGEVTTRKDPEGRPTVFDRLPPMRGSRWVVIGRLDLNTSGLLLFTNDGEMANRLMHPSHEVEREYAVRILGELKPAQRKALLEGVVLEDGLAKFNSIESRGGGGSNRWYHVTLSEGRTREVRRMFESLDLVVSRLIRVRYGPVALDPLLKQGMHRLLNAEEMDRLCEAVGIEPQAPRAERRREYQHSRRSEPMTGRGPGSDQDDEFADEEAAPRASARKPKVIGSKDDDLPLDRVERAAELLRRRRAAESAGVDFSGRNRRLSGKRTLRESELRRIAEEKAAAKKREAGAAAGAGSKRSRSTAAEAAPARTSATPSRAATGRSTSARGASATARPSSRSADARAATRTGTRSAPSRARFERDDDELAPRRNTRASTRPSRGGDEDAPRQRTAGKAGARVSAKPAGKFAAARGERSTSERAPRGRSSAAGAERGARAGGGRTGSAGKPASRSSATRSTTAQSTTAKPARSSAAKPAKSTRSDKTGSRGGSRSGAPSRAGGSRGGARPGGKTKR
ncbi:MAG: 23S rRNA pseudouridine(2605) synthase RluB [Pseudomonadota bacterium]